MIYITEKKIKEISTELVFINKQKKKLNKYKLVETKICSDLYFSRNAYDAKKIRTIPKYYPVFLAP